MRANAQAAPAQLDDPLAQSPTPLQGFRRLEAIELDNLVERALAAAAPLTGPVHWEEHGADAAPACALAVDGEGLQCALTMLIRAARIRGPVLRLDTRVDAAGAAIRVQTSGPQPARTAAIDAGARRAAALMQETLAAAGALVQSQGGQLLLRWAGAESPSTLLIRIPIERTLTPLSRPRGRRKQDPGQRWPVRQRLDGIHVLLVEDDPDALEFLTIILRQTGARVSPFGLAQPAYDFFVTTECKPDIVVSDIGMPGQDGYGMLQKLRRWERVEGKICVPAIAVSAFGRNEDVRRCVTAGFDRHLAKPVESAQILDEIAGWFPRLR